MRTIRFSSSNNKIDTVYSFLLGKDRLNRSDAVWAYIFCLPWLIGFLMLTVGPFVVSAVMSFFEWRGFGKATFRGFYNYEWIFTRDRLFRKALDVTFTFTGMSVPLTLVVSFLVAAVLSRDLKGVTVYRAIFYLPSVVTGVAVAFMWMYIFDPLRGPLNVLLQPLLGLDEPIPWLSSPDWVLPSFTVMRVWGLGTSMIILLAGLKSIPRSMYEIATIDGASALQKFWYVTLPMVSPSLFYVLVIGTIQSFQVLTGPLVIFDSSAQGGPLNAGLFYSVYLYTKAFAEGRMGYASALAWILFVIVLSLTLINFLVFGKRVYYEK